MPRSPRQIHKGHLGSPEIPKLVLEGQGLGSPPGCRLGWWGHLIFIPQGNSASLIPWLLHFSPSCSPVFSTLNPFQFPHLIFSPKEFRKTELAIFFPLKPATWFTLLPLPDFFWPCLSSLISTKEAYPGKGALGKSTDQQI